MTQDFDNDDKVDNELEAEFQCVVKGFAIALSLLIIYLAIFSLDKRLAILWLICTPTVFFTLLAYDRLTGKEMFNRGIDIDLILSIGGPFSIVGFLISLAFIYKGIIDEKYEESFSEEGDGDTRHDKHEETRREQIKKESSKSKESSQNEKNQSKTKE